MTNYIFIQNGYQFSKFFLFKQFLKVYEKQELKNLLKEGKSVEIDILGIDYFLEVA
jgi:hypothetical protein